ncbi:MAG: creatininase family protein [Lachnospiraceae bacterium]|nr:creatininase family protein [Lachnospiraceae bacterium]
MEKLIINQMTWPELEAELAHVKLALVPVGSCEQHGPNTTFNTDAARAASYAEMLAGRCGKKVVVFPCVTYGLSLHHMDFPGTVTLRVETMLHLLEDIGVSIAKHGIKKILFLNAHGGNFPALEGAVINLKQLHGIDAYWSAVGSEISLGGLTGLPKLIGHACEVETSSCLYLCPETVREERVPGMLKDSMLTHDSFVKGGGAWSWKNDASLNGALGDARKATREIGEKMTVASLDYMEKIVDEIIKRP